MSELIRERFRKTDFELFAALAIIAIGLALKFWLKLPVDLWEDEIISATHANQPIFNVIIDTVRNDVHPPLYFLQLHFWSILGRSDAWLVINSIIWSVIGAASFWWVVRQHFGSRMALFACAIYEIMPPTVYMSNQLRMYAFLSVLIIWSFHFAILVFEKGKASLANLVVLIGLLLAIILTHAIGAIAVAMNGLYALLLLRKHKRSCKLWASAYGIAATSALPWIITGVLHDANLQEGRGVLAILLPLSSSIVGILAGYNATILAAGTVLFVGIAAFGISRAQTFSITVCFLIAPTLLAVAFLLFKPIYKWNFFSTAIGPFAALIIATMFVDRRRVSTFCGLLCVVVLAGITIYQRVTFRESSGYFYLSELIKQNYKPGDIIYIPQQSNFWGLARYVIGPDWGSPLVIAAKPSTQWRAVYDRLGPRVVDLLGLVPKAQAINKDGYIILTGPSYNGVPIQARRIWLVTVPRADLKAGYPPAKLGGLPSQWSSTENTWVTLYAEKRPNLIIPIR